MTSETINNVPRELLVECARLLNIHDSGGGSNEQFAVEDLRALLAAPAVDRQPLIHINPAVLAMLRGERTPMRGGLTYSESKPLGNWTVPLYTAPPELAELQATIAKQAAEIERLKVAQSNPVAYLRNEGTPNNLVMSGFGQPGAFKVFREFNK